VSLRHPIRQISFKQQVLFIEKEDLTLSEDMEFLQKHKGTPDGVPLALLQALVDA
jgi:hypothetical protein